MPVSEVADAIGIEHPARLRLRSKTHHALVLWVAGVLQACVLVLTSGAQIYDTNFNTLAETPGLLAGDHPYRDFFDWGVPLQAALSATMQWLVECSQLIEEERGNLSRHRAEREDA